MRRKLRAAGWAALALGVVALATGVTVAAFRAHGGDEFNRVVGWSTIWALVVAALGVLLVVLDKLFPQTESVERSLADVEDELAKIVYTGAVDLRSRLIGAGEVGDEPANVRFTKMHGRFREVGGERTGDLLNVSEYFRSLSPRRLVVLGEPGAGKSVLAVELQVCLLEQRNQDRSQPIPILISAAAYDSEHGWRNWLINELEARFAIACAAAVTLVRDGRILPIVDGLDEMDAADAAERPRAAQFGRAAGLVKALNASMLGRQRAPVVVTCRSKEYQALGRGINRATHVEMIPLGGAEAAGYLCDQFLDEDEAERWAPVLTAMRADTSGPTAKRLSTPWRLTLALGAYRDHGDPVALLLQSSAEGPGNSAYLEDVVDRELLRQYIANAVRMHDKAARYRLADVQRWLVVIADGLSRQAGRGMSATDMELARWWQPTTHRLTLALHAALSALILVPLWVFAALSENYDLWMFLPVVAFLVLPGLTGASTTADRWNFRRLRTAQGIREIGLWVIAGVAYWLTPGLAGWHPPALYPKFWFTMLVGIGYGLTCGLSPGLMNRKIHLVSPRDVINTDGAPLAMYGLMGFMAGEAFGMAGPLAGGIVIALAGGLGGGLGSGSYVWTNYHIAIAVTALRRRGPWRFGRFLDWALDAGLLRVSGVAYQFRHRELQQWLTSRSTAWVEPVFNNTAPAHPLSIFRAVRQAAFASRSERGS